MEINRNLSLGFIKIWNNIRIVVFIALSILRTDIEEVMVVIYMVDNNSLCKIISVRIHLGMTSDTDQAWVVMNVNCKMTCVHPNNK